MNLTVCQFLKCQETPSEWTWRTRRQSTNANPSPNMGYKHVPQDKYLTSLLWNPGYTYVPLHFKRHFIEREENNEQLMH